MRALLTWWRSTLILEYITVGEISQRGRK
ncbi:hypothetical protein E2C01_063443 [Portunus trituberculatus]|uniref:Uncharacterized protein n=1 Tax=Portunus trituberculatus TaxID=210409 RepID=A0A5B7HH19_PORTR|nr:hypothetical protein [Portunus trituberculatus]